MTPADRVFATEEALSSPGAIVLRTPFGTAQIATSFPHLPDANRLLVPSGRSVRGEELIAALEREFGSRGIARVQCVIGGGVPPGPIDDLLREAASASGTDPHELLFTARERPPEAEVSSEASRNAALAIQQARSDRDWIAIETILAELSAEREEPPARAAMRAQWLRRTAPALQAEWFLATLSGAPAGLAGLFVLPDRTARLMSVAARPALRRRGVATALALALADAAFDRGSDLAAAAVDSDDDETARSAGFRIVGGARAYEIVLDTGSL